MIEIIQTAAIAIIVVVVWWQYRYIMIDNYIYEHAFDRGFNLEKAIRNQKRDIWRLRSVRKIMRDYYGNSRD